MFNTDPLRTPQLHNMDGRINMATLDRAHAAAKASRQMHEAHGIQGHVRVVKNRRRKSELVVCDNEPNLLTNAGRDAFHDMLYEDTDTANAAFDYIAVSPNTGTPAANWTTLAGEVTASDLARAQGDASHTDGEATTAIEHEFTAANSYTNLRLAALFNASSSGTMAHVKDFTNVSLGSGDTLTITWTITLQ